MAAARIMVFAAFLPAGLAQDDAAAEEIRSPETWETIKARRVEEMRDMLGLLPWPARTPLNVRSTGVLDKGDYTIEKIALESLPKLYVTANLYLPKRRAGRLPAVVYVCGHALSPYGAKTKYQRHGISLAKNGYVALVVDPIQIAELFSMHHAVVNQEMPDWYARGYTPAGVEVWNAMRAIDYLETRPEVDKLAPDLPPPAGVTGFYRLYLIDLRQVSGRCQDATVLDSDLRHLSVSWATRRSARDRCLGGDYPLL